MNSENIFLLKKIPNYIFQSKKKKASGMDLSKETSNKTLKLIKIVRSKCVLNLFLILKVNVKVTV